MVKIFGRGKDKEREAFARELTATHVANRGQARTMRDQQQQQLNMLGRAYYLQEDENVQAVIMQYCPQLSPAFSRLNATSKIDKPRDRRLMQLLFKDLLLHLQMELAGDEDTLARSLIKALGINAEFRILDAMGGYRGKLVTEEIERTTVKVEQPKKKGFL